MELIDPLLLAQPHLSKVLQPPQAVQPTGDQEFKHRSLWEYFIFSRTVPLSFAGCGGMSLKFQSLYSHTDYPSLMTDYVHITPMQVFRILL